MTTARRTLRESEGISEAQSKTKEAGSKAYSGIMLTSRLDIGTSPYIP